MGDPGAVRQVVQLAVFEAVNAIDRTLEAMIWRVVSRYAELAGGAGDDDALGGAPALRSCILRVSGHREGLRACECEAPERRHDAAPGGQVLVTDFHPAAYGARMRRTFRDGDEVVEVAHYVHDAGTQIAAARLAGLRLLARSEAAIDSSVRPFFEAAGRLDVYEKQYGVPLVSALLFVRDG